MGMKFSHKIAITIVVVISIWIVSGQIFTVDDKKSPAVEKRAALVDVRVKSISAADYSRRFRVYGATESVRKVMLKAETEGKVVEILAQEGQFLEEGMPILQLDMRDREVRLLQAKSLVAQKALDYKATKSLSRKGLQSETKLAQMRAELDAANALLVQIEIDITNTTIKAPFDGKLDKVHKEVGDVVEAMKDEVATVITVDPFLVVGYISEKWVRDIREGMPVNVHLASKQDFEGEITFLSSIANPATRTFRIEVEISSAVAPVAEGISAAMEIFFAPVAAHYIPASALTLNDKGNIGVKIVDAAGRAQFLATEILDETESGTWVSGLPKMVDVITLGQAFVRPGDRVTIVQNPDKQSIHNLSSSCKKSIEGAPCESIN